MMLIFFLSVFWFLPIYLSGELYKSRGLNPSKGQLISFFLGWIGTILIWIFLPEKKIVKLFPSDDNPCIDHTHGRKAAMYDVKGVITKLCVYCVSERSKDVGIETALKTFKPSSQD